MSVEEYLNKSRPCLKDINNLKKSNMWKIQLTIAVNFISFADNDEKCVMHSKSDKIEIMINDKGDEIIGKLFKSLLKRYQIGLETSKRGSNFIFDCVLLLYHKCPKKFKPGGSYIDSPNWTKNKKATINPINKEDNKYFQYAVTVALNYEEIKKDS